MFKRPIFADRALGFSLLNWQVFPMFQPQGDSCGCGNPGCQNAGKHPAVKWGSEATTDEATIRRWGMRWPNANIGIKTGAASNLVVIDVDQKGGGFESLARLEAEHGLLQAPWVNTGGGGRHYYFRHPGVHVKSTAGVLAPGIDIRADGGCVVAPGSLHKSGEFYEWATGQAPSLDEIPELPEWLLKLITASKRADGGKLDEATDWVKQDFPPAKFDQIAQGCEVMRFVRDNPSMVSEPLWYASASIWGHCENGEQLAQELSKGHPKFNPEETAQKLRQAVEQAGPRTCKGFAELGCESLCAKCPSRGRIKSPITLGISESQMAAVQTASEFGIRPDPTRYHMDARGVFMVRYDPKTGEYQPGKPIATRPIYPSLIGDDVATGRTYVRLSYTLPLGGQAHRWLEDRETNDRTTIMGLPGAPVSQGRYNSLTDWLADSKGYVVKKAIKVSSRAGWVGKGDGLQFVMPGDPKIQYIGDDLEVAGTVLGWVKGLLAILLAGPGGYPALVALGASAASPVVRLLGKRNPVIGFTAESSLGKGTVIDYATSIYGPPSVFTVPAGSTAKGTQDITIGMPDFPVFVDELQQLYQQDPRKVATCLYYLGNGQRRVTSTVRQKATGGEKRFGVGFYAAEQGILRGLNLGAMFRAIEIHGAPMPNEELALLIKGVTRGNYGVIGPLIAAKVNEDRDRAALQVEAEAERIKCLLRHGRGEDSFAIALVAYGLQLLASVLEVELPIKEAITWLIETVNDNRAESVDRYTAAWQKLIGTITGMTSNSGYLALEGGGNSITHLGHHVAWLEDQAPHSTGGLDINPNAPTVVTALRDLGESPEACGKIWAERGWLERRRSETKVPRKVGNQTVRVWRVTAEGAQAAGLGPRLHALPAPLKAS